MRIGMNIPQFQNAIQSADLLANEALSQNLNQAEPASLNQIQDSFSNSGINESEFVQSLQSGQIDLNPDSRLQGLMRNPGLYKNPVYRNYVEAGLFDPIAMPEKLLQKVSDSLKQLMPTPYPISPVDSSSDQNSQGILPGEIVTSGPTPLSSQSGLSDADQRAIIIIGGSPVIAPEEEIPPPPPDPKIPGGTDVVSLQNQALQEMQSAVQESVGLRQQMNNSMFKGIMFR
jgi:hypothetical protein